MEGLPGGVHMVLEGIDGKVKKVIAVGYRYSVKKTLFFVFTPGAESIRQGAP